jgi:hypothetical protein
VAKAGHAAGLPVRLRSKPSRVVSKQFRKCAPLKVRMARWCLFWLLKRLNFNALAGNPDFYVCTKIMRNKFRLLKFAQMKCARSYALKNGASAMADATHQNYFIAALFRRI